MPLSPLPEWQQTMKDIPPVNGPIWPKNLADWLFQRVNGKLQLSLIVGPHQFIFNQSVFMASLMQGTPSDQKSSGAKVMAEAFEKSVLASQMNVSPGASLGVPTPATMWSAPACLIDSGSLAAAKAKLFQDMSQISLVDDGGNSQLPKFLYQAFLQLTYTVQGINMVVPVPGPLIAPMIKVC